MPEMHPVASSNIEAIGFDPDSRELYVLFMSGKTYIYSNVDEWVFTDMLMADSKGSYLNREIRGRYDYREE